MNYSEGQIRAKGLVSNKSIEQLKDMLCAAAYELEERGIITTVGQRPLQPLAIGNYAVVINFRSRLERHR